MQKRLWQIVEYPYHPEKHLYYETIFTIGNGYLSTRASFEEGHHEGTPATLVHGIFDHAPEMSIPELANVPNWLPIHITIDGTPFRLITRSADILRPPEGLMLGYRRTLHMDEGLLRREVLFRAASGSTVRVTFERFASLADVHVLAQRLTITVVDGAPEITLEAAIDGDVSNNGVQHWKDMRVSSDEKLIDLQAVTRQSGFGLGMAAHLTGPRPVTRTAQGKRALAMTSLSLKRGDTAVIDKITALYTSRDVQDPLEAARRKALEAASVGYDRLLADHTVRWAQRWEENDVQIEGDEHAQLALRFTTYHVLIAAPEHDDDVSIGAKTLSGFGYKGHVFWDTDLFILPLLTLTQPGIARNLLMYRYKRLEGARRKARTNGYEGAMFPWESADTGEETTPQWSDPGPDGERIRIWTGDNEQHISTDVSYAILQYWQWTGDDAFMRNCGAEIVLDTAVFWGSRVEDKNGRWELCNQIGPDEYHENIDNSVFTNRMVVWHLQEALKLLDWLRDNAPQDARRLTDQLKLTPERLAHWRDIIARMYIPFDAEKQRHIQFDGFFDLEHIPVPDYEPRVGGVWSMLGHKRARQSQVIKQADVVMLMALLGDQTGPREVMLNNWRTYYPLTDHGSSLSPAVHAWVAARLGLDDEAYHMFEHAADIDLKDNKGNVGDGIHGAACGGLWQAVVFGFCGLHTGRNGPEVDPRLPAHWQRVSFKVTYRGDRKRFTVTNPATVSPQA